MTDPALDPRANLSFEPEPGQVLEDDRTGDLLVIIYIDDRVTLLRDEDGLHRLEPRGHFEENAGSGRYKLSDEERPVEGGHLGAIRSRAKELEGKDGRKPSHQAEALREAAQLLKSGRERESREPISFEEVDGVGQKTADELRSSGYTTAGDVNRADDEELLDVRGVGHGNLDNIREYTKT